MIKKNIFDKSMTRVILLMLLIINFSCSKKSDKLEKVKTYYVKKGNINNSITVDASVLPSQNIIISTPISGVVSKVYQYPGEKVVKNEILFVLKDEKNKYHNITSPVDGLLLNISKDVGEFYNAIVSEDKSLAIITTTTFKKVEARVDELDVEKIKENMNCSFIVNDTTIIYGRIKYINRIAENSNNGVRFKIAGIIYDNKNDIRFYGQTFPLIIYTTSYNDILVVPIEFITTKNNKKYVCSKKEEEIKDIEVKIGKQNETWCEILSGLDVGDKIRINK